MMLWQRVLMVMIMVILLLTGCNNTDEITRPKQESAPMEKKEMIISAAASLKNAMTEIEQAYEAKNTNIDLRFNFGSSGSLQKQIEQGAPADVFLSAGKPQMDALEENNLLLKETRIDFLANRLVLIVGMNNKEIKSFEDLVQAQQISIGTPESVPAGKYAKEALTNMKLWDSLQSKLVLAKDVTQVLTYVGSENVDAGVVYGSDAQSSEKVRVVVDVPADSHSLIVYPGAVIATTQNSLEAEDFMAFVTSSEAQSIFVKYGFKAHE